MATTGSPDRRPQVLLLSHGAERSGPPIVLLRLLRRWHASDPGFDRTVVVGRPGALVEEYAALGAVRVARLDRRAPEQLARRALTAIGAGGIGDRITRTATTVRTGIGGRGRPAPDLVVVNGATSAGVELLRDVVPGVPTALIAHELSTGWMANISEPQRRYLLERTGSFLAVSEAVRAYLVGELGVGDSLITVVPPPVDLPPPEQARASEHSHDERRVARDGRCTVVGGGVTDWRKAPELFLAVAHACRAAAPEIDWRFRWFGGGLEPDPASWPLRFEVDRLDLSDVVTFTGPVDDPATELLSGDLFLSTAREDAAPLVTAEAAARGLPIAAFDSGGVEELVAEGDCGEIVAYPDVTGLAGVVVALARDPERRRRLGDSGAAFVAAERRSEVVADRVAAWIRGTLTP